jgi:hypothetical protein
MDLDVQPRSERQAHQDAVEVVRVGAAPDAPVGPPAGHAPEPDELALPGELCGARLLQDDQAVPLRRVSVRRPADDDADEELHHAVR